MFAYLPAGKLSDRSGGKPLRVTFALTDGQKLRGQFRPDTADWFEAAPRGRREDRP